MKAYPSTAKPLGYRHGTCIAGVVYRFDFDKPDCGVVECHWKDFLYSGCQRVRRIHQVLTVNLTSSKIQAAKTEVLLKTFVQLRHHKFSLTAHISTDPCFHTDRHSPRLSCSKMSRNQLFDRRSQRTRRQRCSGSGKVAAKGTPPERCFRSETVEWKIGERVPSAQSPSINCC